MIKAPSGSTLASRIYYALTDGETIFRSEDSTEVKTWTVTLSDNSGNDSATTVTGYYSVIGNMCFASFSNLNNISTAGMTAGDPIVISLPISSNAVSGRSSGLVLLDNFNYGTGATESSILLGPGISSSRLYTSGDGVADRQMIVSDITTGSSDIIRFSLTYFV